MSAALLKNRKKIELNEHMRFTTTKKRTSKMFFTKCLCPKLLIIVNKIYEHKSMFTLGTVSKNEYI